MPKSPMSMVLQHSRAAFERDGAGMSDGELLNRFLTGQDGAALAALVRRHPSIVWSVCRRLLRNYHDTEDAFQATFLVLVRKGASIRDKELVANWLYGVAHQIALRVRATAAKQSVRERQVVDIPEPVVIEPRGDDLSLFLDQELSRLPEKFRVLIVLCDLEGKTRKEVAGQLDCPEGTVASRLARARVMLAKRLTRHGLSVSNGTLATVLCQNMVLAGVPTSVVSSTIKAAYLFAAGKAAATGVISGKVVALTEGVLKTMLLKKLKVVVVLLLAALSGAAGLIYQTQATEQPKAHGATEKEKQPTPRSATSGPAEGEKQPAPNKSKPIIVRLGSVKSSDDKQTMIGINIDDYYPELSDRGIPRTKLPLAKEVEVLIDGKKAKITDLLPGDRIVLQLSPDNKSVTRIELTLKPQLDALEKEADALRERIDAHRQRIKRLEKGE